MLISNQEKIHFSFWSILFCLSIPTGWIFSTSWTIMSKQPPQQPNPTASRISRAIPATPDPNAATASRMVKRASNGKNTGAGPSSMCRRKDIIVDQAPKRVNMMSTIMRKKQNGA